MLKRLTFIAAAIITICCSLPAFADVKIKSKQTMSGQTYENTTYIKGRRQRTETMNGMTVNLMQCDLRRGVQMNPATQTYMINAFTSGTADKTANASTAKVDSRGVVQAGGTVTTTVAIKDTGERKQMFGYTARHLIITMETVSSPDACNKANYKMVTDGWYIDFENQFDCGDNVSYGGYRDPSKPTCTDKYVSKNTGAGKRGYPVYEKLTMFDEGGKETMGMVTEVVELSKAVLPADLFDIPQDYTEAANAAQMYATASTANSASTPKSGYPSSSNGSSVVSNAANAQPTSGTNTVGPKKAGTIRIGLVGVKTGSVGDGLTAGELSAAVQNTLVNYLKVPNVEVVSLEARLDSGIKAEAKEKECDYLLNAAVSHKKGGGGFGGMFAKSLGTAAIQVGAGLTGGAAGMIVGQAATSAILGSTLSSKMKSKDEVSLDINLTDRNGASAVAQIFKAKAKGSGDDVITAVVEQAAKVIVEKAK